MRTFLAFLAAVASASAALPQLRVGLQQAALTEFKNAIVPIINEELAGGISVPDVSTEVDVPVVGHVDVDVTNMVINNFNLGDAALTMSPTNTIEFSISSLNFELKCHFHTRKKHWPHVSQSGDLSAKPEDTDASMMLTIGSDGAKPFVHVASDNVHIGKFDLHFSGTWDAWIINLFKDLFNGMIKHSVESAVEKALTKVIDDSFNGFLQSESYVGTIGGGDSAVTFNGSVLQMDVVGTGEQAMLDVALLMSATNAKTGQLCPDHVQTALPQITSVGGSEFQLVVSTNMLTCAFWPSYVNNATEHFSNATVKPDFPVPLYTDAWRSVLPGLADKFPGRPMNLNAWMAQPVVFNASNSTGVQASAEAGIDLLVVQEDGSVVQACTLGVSGTGALKVTIANRKDGNATVPAVVLEITEGKAGLHVIESSIGKISLGALNLLLDASLPVIIKGLNKLLAVGVPIPSLFGISVVDPQIEYIQNGFLANTNIQLDF